MSKLEQLITEEVNERIHKALGEPLRYEDYHHGKYHPDFNANGRQCVCVGCTKVTIINRYRELVIKRLQD